MTFMKTLLLTFGVFYCLITPSTSCDDFFSGVQCYGSADAPWELCCAHCPGKHGVCAGDCEWDGSNECVDANCISGDVNLPAILFHDDSRAEQLVAVKDLHPGDKVLGLDQSKAQAWCTIEAIGVFAQSGVLYCNFTSNHFVLAPDGSMMRHGEFGEMRQGTLYNMITSCPATVDEGGTAFTVVDRFCGTDEMEWSDYIILHEAMLRLVKASGPFWFLGSTYNKAGNVAATGGFPSSLNDLCSTMLTCAKNDAECEAFEATAALFVREYVEEDAQRKTNESFPKLGSNGMPGSVSYVVTNKHKTPTAVALYVVGSLLFIASTAGAIWCCLRRPGATAPAKAVVIDNDVVGMSDITLVAKLEFSRVANASIQHGNPPTSWLIEGSIPPALKQDSVQDCCAASSEDLQADVV